MALFPRMLIAFLSAMGQAREHVLVANLVYTRGADRMFWPALRESTARYLAVPFFRHYLCVDEPAARLSEAWIGWTVLSTVGRVAGTNGTDASQDTKLLDCARRLSEPAVLVSMSDWLVRRPADANALQFFAGLVANASSAVTFVELWCREANAPDQHTGLDFGGVRSPWPGLYLSLGSMQLPRLWRRSYLVDRYLPAVVASLDWFVEMSYPTNQFTREEGFSKLLFRRRDDPVFTHAPPVIEALRESGNGLALAGAPYCVEDAAGALHTKPYDFFHTGHGHCVVWDVAFCDADAFPGMVEASASSACGAHGRGDPCERPRVTGVDRWDLPMDRQRAKRWEEDVRRNYTHGQRSRFWADRVVAADPEGCHLAEPWDPAASVLAHRGDADVAAARAVAGPRVSCCVPSFFNGRHGSRPHKVACWNNPHRR